MYLLKISHLSSKTAIISSSSGLLALVTHDKTSNTGLHMLTYSVDSVETAQLDYLRNDSQIHDNDNQIQFHLFYHLKVNRSVSNAHFQLFLKKHTHTHRHISASVTICVII